MVVKKAVIPAAGLGTRFLPATKAQPKEMLPIVDKPAIQFVVEEAVNSGLHDILIITGRGKRAIEDHFDLAGELEFHLQKHGKKKELQALQSVDTISSMAKIHFVRQREPKGLGHAVLQAKDHVGNEPFAVLLGDDIVADGSSCLDSLIEFHKKTKASVIALQEVPIELASKYGTIEGEEIEKGFFKIANLEEKAKAPKTNLAIMGRYILNPEIFNALENTKPDSVTGEIQLTHGLSLLSQTQPIYGFLYKGLRWDIGDKKGFLKATVDYALSKDGEIKEEFLQYLKEKLSKLK